VRSPRYSCPFGRRGSAVAAGSGRLFDILVRYRFAVLVMLCVAVATVTLDRAPCNGDAIQFGDAGRSLLTGHWGRVYAESSNQGGPLELLWNTAVRTGATGCSTLSQSLLPGVVVCAAVVAAVLSCGRLLLPVRPASVSARVELLLGSVAVLLVCPLTLQWEHPADVMIPLLWMVTFSTALRRRPVLAGVLLGMACGWETWAVLGLPLLATGSFRHALRGASAAGVVGLIWYLPFIGTGHFAMFDMVWAVDPTTVFGALTHRSVDTWEWRAGQGFFVSACGYAAAMMARRRPHSSWVPALVLSLSRVLTDPVSWPYYALLLLVPAVIAVGATVSTGRLRWVRIVFAGLGMLMLVCPRPDSLVGSVFFDLAGVLVLWGAFPVVSPAEAGSQVPV
jgi:hypothetical protein